LHTPEPHNPQKISKSIHIKMTEVDLCKEKVSTIQHVHMKYYALHVHMQKEKNIIAINLHFTLKRTIVKHRKKKKNN
jgi:hypothetical protein